jgi:hypothetical protein
MCDLYLAEKSCWGQNRGPGAAVSRLGQGMTARVQFYTVYTIQPVVYRSHRDKKQVELETNDIFNNMAEFFLLLFEPNIFS